MLTPLLYINKIFRWLTLSDKLETTQASASHNVMSSINAPLTSTVLTALPVLMQNAKATAPSMTMKDQITIWRASQVSPLRDFVYQPQ